MLKWLRFSYRYLLVVVAALVLTVGGFAVISAQADGVVTPAGQGSFIQVADTTNLFTQVYQQVSPSVVAIHVLTTGPNGRVIGSGTGSGFVLDRDGHIVTNNHVVSDANSIEIEFLDGTLAAAEVVGLDPNSDLAVLSVKVPAEQLVPVTFGDSNQLVVGETVLAIGSPFGQDWTLTTGIVSGVNRIISGLTDFSIGGVIQTDAAINPGNSGGPLLNLQGQIVGVNSQILSESGSSAGIGFAVPSNLVQRVVGELMNDGRVDYSYIGITGTDVTLSMIEALKLPEHTRGVIVEQTVSGGPAAQAGLQDAALTQQFASTNAKEKFDIITGINGTAVKGMDELITFLARETVPNQTVTLNVLRNGTETLDISVTLASRPSATIR